VVPVGLSTSKENLLSPLFQRGAHRSLILERILAVGKELIAEGAHALIPLGGRLVPYVVSTEELEAEFKVPVINTKRVNSPRGNSGARKNKPQHQKLSLGRQPDTGKRHEPEQTVKAPAGIVSRPRSHEQVVVSRRHARESGHPERLIS
jgi:hypothetical protein